MKKLVYIVLLIGFSVNAQSQLISSQKELKTDIVSVSDDFASTRFIMMGSSTTYEMYFFEEQVETLINNTYPNEVVEVNNEGSPGATIDSYKRNQFDTALANYPFDPTIDTYVVIMLGDNNGRLNVYSTLSQAAIDIEQNSLNYMLDSIEAKGFKPVLLDTKFCNFQPTTAFPNGFGPAYDNENLGTKPYNDNIIIPTILSRTSTSEFAFSDGQNFMQAYTFFYNNYPAYDSGDGVHPSGAGYVAFRTHFVNTLCKYIFTGVPPIKIVKNQQNPTQEQEYYAATYVSPANASTIQTVLNNDGAVRLGSGDYTACGNLTLTSNMRIYGWLDSFSQTGGNITISAGSTNIHIENLELDNDLILQAGSEISDLKVKNLAYSRITGAGFRLVNSEFINSYFVTLDFDNSLSGYTRNNRFTKIWQQASNNQVNWIGNTTEVSYGNIELSRNFLTSTGDIANYDTLESHTLLGTDSENWDNTGIATKSPYYFRNSGQVNIFNSFGFSTPALAPEFDIEADLVWMQRKYIGSNQTPIFRTGTNVLYVDGDKIAPSYESSNFYLEAYHTDNDIIFNGSDLSSEITGTNATTLNGMIYKTPYTPISKPVFETIPNPTGVDWSTNRVGQADQSAFIQNLIDTNGYAELDAGIYYISQPLLVSSGQGIIGKGTGKTAIVGITDDFPLIKVRDVVTSGSQSTNNHHLIAYLTLQGGNIGYHIQPIDSNLNVYMITNNSVRDVVFRDQADGILFELIHGYDNNFFSDLTFINCVNGIRQNAGATGGGINDVDIAYMDKTVFYRCQFINNTTALNLVATRANNLNSWVDCNFDGNVTAFNTEFSNALYVANSTFSNHTGSSIMTGNAPMSLYGCDFNNNSVTNVFDKGIIYGEGNNFSDSSVNLFAGINKEFYMWNSNISSILTTNQIDKGLLINNNVTNNASLSKPMVEVISGTPLTILDGTVNVYPQLLVKQ